MSSCSGWCSGNGAGGLPQMIVTFILHSRDSLHKTRFTARNQHQHLKRIYSKYLHKFILGWKWDWCATIDGVVIVDIILTKKRNSQHKISTFSSHWKEYAQDSSMNSSCVINVMWWKWRSVGYDRLRRDCYHYSWEPARPHKNIFSFPSRKWYVYLANRFS